MSRPPRVDYPGAFHHVMNRGARRAPIFGDREDCFALFDTLHDACNRFGVEIHGYSLMPNHYHLLVRSVHGDLSVVMQFITSQFTRRLNRRHRWDGPVFRGRYRSQLIQKPGHLRVLLPYLHLNPVRAHLVARPDAEAWTSHRAYLGMESRPEWLSTGTFLRLLGGRARLRELVASLHRRSATWPPELDLETGWFHDDEGDEPGDSAESTPRRPAAPRRPGATSGARLAPEEVLSRVAAIAGVSRAELLTPRRGPRGNEARRLAVWALVRRNATRHADAARLLKMTEAAVAKSASRTPSEQTSEVLLGWMRRWDEGASEAATAAAARARR